MTQEEIQASVAGLLDNDVIRELFEKRVKQTVSNQKTRIKNAPKHEAARAERERVKAEKRAVLESLTPEQLAAIKAMVKAEAQARLAAETVAPEPESEAVAA